jgi:formylmethanofuran dehydrogenase subunit E
MKHDARQQAWLDKLPKCENCGQAIQQDTAVEIEGCLYCDECLNKDLRVSIEYEC